MNKHHVSSKKFFNFQKLMEALLKFTSEFVMIKLNYLHLSILYLPFSSVQVTRLVLVSPRLSQCCRFCKIGPRRIYQVTCFQRCSLPLYIWTSRCPWSQYPSFLQKYQGPFYHCHQRSLLRYHMDICHPLLSGLPHQSNHRWP